MILNQFKYNISRYLVYKFKIMKPQFQDFPLTLLNPSFDSDLIDVLTELEKLRTLA